MGRVVKLEQMVSWIAVSANQSHLVRRSQTYVQSRSADRPEDKKSTKTRSFLKLELGRDPVVYFRYDLYQRETISKSNAA